MVYDDVFVKRIFFITSTMLLLWYISRKHFWFHPAYVKSSSHKLSQKRSISLDKLLSRKLLHQVQCSSVCHEAIQDSVQASISFIPIYACSIIVQKHYLVFSQPKHLFNVLIHLKDMYPTLPSLFINWRIQSDVAIDFITVVQSISHIHTNTPLILQYLIYLPNGYRL